MIGTMTKWHGLPVKLFGHEGEVQFDEPTHTYTSNGVVVPSVTEILRVNGVSPQYQFADADLMEEYRRRGQNVHTAIQYEWEGKFDEAGEYERDKTRKHPIMGYMQAWWRARKKFGIDIVSMERRVVDMGGRAAGRYDILAMAEDCPTIIDIKTHKNKGEPLNWVGMQLMGYASMLSVRTDYKFRPSGLAIVLHPDSKFSFMRFGAGWWWGWSQIWDGLVRTAHWKYANKIYIPKG